MEPQKLTFSHPDQDQQKSLHLVQEGISAGFPSPAEDYIELGIDLNKYFQQIRFPHLRILPRATIHYK